MTKKTTKQQKNLKTDESKNSPVVSTSSTEVPAPLPEPTAELAAPTPPTPPTPSAPVSPAKPQLLILRKAGEQGSELRSDRNFERSSDRNFERSSDRNFERSSDRRPERRGFPAPSKPPAQLTECGKYKAGDEVTLPYSGKVIAFSYFYQGANPTEWWGAFEGGCVRLSTID